MIRVLCHSHLIGRWLSAVMIAASLLLALPNLALAAAQTQATAAQTVLVHFDSGTTLAARDALIAQSGGELVKWMPQIHVAEVRLPVQDEVTIASLPLMANERVAFFEPDLLMVQGAHVPNDPDFRDETMSYGLRQVQALEAWDITTGSEEIVIAVIDSGINADHPEFVDRLVPGYDFIDNDELPEDVHGHGTYVAGVIAASLDNHQGIAGVCPNCRIMPVRVLNDMNLGSWSQLANGILFAVDQGARIINLSVGSAVRSETVALAIEHALESGVVVVAAAGNNGSDAAYYPAAFDGVIGVGATTRDGERWSKSNFGQYIDLTAPGDVIYSTYHDLDNAYYGYTYMSGTSMATPFVSGVAGLLLSVEPSLSAEEVTEALLFGADDLGEKGWDADFGHGRVNALGALMSPVQGLSEAVDVIVPQPDESYSPMVMFLPSLNNEP